MMSLLNQMRTIYYRVKYQYGFRRATFGKDISICCKLAIVGPGKVSIGDGCLLLKDPFGNDYVTLYTHRPSARINIGKHVILRATRFGSHLAITVEDGCVLESASVYDSDFHKIDATRRNEGFNANDREVIIGSDSYVGVDCLCSKGTVLGVDIVLQAASVIGTKKIPAGKFIGGNPAMLVKV